MITARFTVLTETVVEVTVSNEEALGFAAEQAVSLVENGLRNRMAVNPTHGSFKAVHISATSSISEV